MSITRFTILFVLAISAFALVPVQAEAAVPPRVVALADLGTRPVEVAISSKQVTLIHFEPGDVSMVAVGDPAIVSVTVKGPNVLLKALASSGSTNAFIWQASRYTQWTFTIRQNSRDARVIIVRDSAANSRNESNSKTAGGERVGKMPAVTSAPAQQPSEASASQQPATTTEKPTDDCGSALTLDQFIKALNARQPELPGGFLAESTLARLQTLLSELSPPQRCGLLTLLSSTALSRPPATGSLGSSGVAGTPSAVGAQNAAQASSSTAASCSGSALAETRSPPAPSKSLMPAGVAFSVTPLVVDGQLVLYYVLENHTYTTLLTDILRLRVSDRNGNRVAFRINRASQDGYVGRLQTDGVEYGVIAVDTHEKLLRVEWRLLKLGSGSHERLRVEIEIQ